MAARECLTDAEWEGLLQEVCEGKCTPFLGAGACAGTLPMGGEIARRWADQHEFPFAEGRDDLARVAEFLAVTTRNAVIPKYRIRNEFRAVPPPDFEQSDEPHGALARLPFPIYMTTNYDDFMYEALVRAGKAPERELCRWHRDRAFDDLPVILDGSFVPEPMKPVVFHLHGWMGIAESLVLTEDDYLDFLVAVSRDELFLLPPEVHSASSASLIFIGYSLADWNLRVILRGILGKLEHSNTRLSVTVQLPRDHPEQEAYMEQYFSWLLEVKVFWGTANEFARELRKRWEDFEPTCTEQNPPAGQVLA